MLILDLLFSSKVGSCSSDLFPLGFSASARHSAISASSSFLSPGSSPRSCPALLALLTHQYPESMGVSGTVLAVDIYYLSVTPSQVIARTILMWVSAPLHYILEKADSVLPTSLLHMLSKM